MTNTTDSHIPTIVYVEDNAGDARLLVAGTLLTAVLLRQVFRELSTMRVVD